MERGCEEATQEPPRGGAGAVGRPGPERGQEARCQGERPQGGSGQKPQETNCRPPQCTTSAPRPPQGIIDIIDSIRARFGASVIGLGHQGIRFAGL